MSDVQPHSDEMLVRVQRENFSIDQELERVKRRSKRIGGIATFLGIARDRSKGRDVDSITFEHYAGMAEKKLREIRERRIDTLTVMITAYATLANGDPIAKGRTVTGFANFARTEYEGQSLREDLMNVGARLEYKLTRTFAIRAARRGFGLRLGPWEVEAAEGEGALKTRLWFNAPSELHEWWKGFPHIEPCGAQEPILL